MNFKTLISAVAGVAVLTGCSGTTASPLASPDGQVKVDFSINSKGQPTYTLNFQGKQIIAPSTLGFASTEGGVNFHDGFKLDSVSTSSFHEVWAPVWGENDSIDNTYNQAIYHMSNASVRMDVEFRVYDDGIGFRYVFPEQGRDSLLVAEELTQFAMGEDLTAWWIPGDYDTQEYEYVKSRLSEIRAKSEDEKMGNVAQTSFSPTGVQTSLMLKRDDGVYMNIHEAAVVDYPVMHLDLNDTTLTFQSHLTPGLPPYKARLEFPRATPWRVIMVGDEATDILASNLVYNLNEPNKLEDTSWIHPIKFNGVWWEMITGKSTWSYTNLDDVDLATVDYSKTKPSGTHGATNENVRRYIDFAAENGIDEVLVEGWNIGWEDWLGKEKDFVFDFVTPYPDFDIKALNEYAQSKGVKLMMHHETSGSVANYEKRLEEAYNLMNKYGYDAVKSGYVGHILPKGETHYSQRMMNHYLDAVKKAAEHKIMVNAHEAARPTGLARTYPNLVGIDSAMGQEYRQMSEQHVTILPFTRLKGGPMDFTPGLFTMDLSEFVPGSTEHKKATIGNQLALYVTMYSPIQMVADLPENYAKKMDAFQFIKDVPVDWSRSEYLDAEPGEFIVVARQEKGSDDWYVGGVTNADARDYSLNLDFLPEGATYTARIYADAPDADAVKNPEAYVISEQEVTSATTLPMHMAPGGGFAISLKKK